MEWWRLGLDVFNAAKWVALAAFVVWVFREPLRKILREVRSGEVEAGPFKGKFDTRDQEAISQAGGELARPSPEAEELSRRLQERTGDDSSESLAEAAREAQAPVKFDLTRILEHVKASNAERERQRRAEVEELITASVGYGWAAGRGPFQSRPYPVIEWTEDGAPVILYTTSDEKDALRRSAYRSADRSLVDD
jgi:hypothetical protein